MARFPYYFTYREPLRRRINLWDVIALFIIFSIIAALAWGAKQMATPYLLGDPLPLSLAPNHLPFYAIRTILRMAIAMVFSLLFTFTVGTWAAKSKRAEVIIIPLVDILQAVPVLSFLSISIVGFIALFPNSLLGPECASIFAIFTAQAWNMVLGFYQSLKTLPSELTEASDMLQLTAWQRFWRMEVPFSMSNLIWNMMMSMSASWFFVVASEAIAVSNQNIRLPGIGSYIALAIEQMDLTAVFYAILTMLVVILIYDQLLFRPLLQWSDKFKPHALPEDNFGRSWVITLLQRTRLLKVSGALFSRIADWFSNLTLAAPRKKLSFIPEKKTKEALRLNWLWTASFVLITLAAIVWVTQFITKNIPASEIWHVFLLGAATATRIIILLILCSLLWVPVGVWIGRRPAVAYFIQPVIQFLASFPANLLFPLVVMLIVHYQLNVEIWTSPLMILGSQWYILFNVISGTTSLPKELYQAADNFGVSGWQWWWRLALPGIFPYYITGAITAAGGAWNASIVAEWVSWGDTTLHATGLGEYITAYTRAGDFPRIALGTGMMCLFVLMFNRVLWRPLYRLAQERYSPTL